MQVTRQRKLVSHHHKLRLAIAGTTALVVTGTGVAYGTTAIFADNQVGTEDRSLVEAVQRGVRSGILTEGRLLSESEQLVAHFQRLCAEALTG